MQVKMEPLAHYSFNFNFVVLNTFMIRLRLGYVECFGYIMSIQTISGQVSKHPVSDTHPTQHL